MNPTLPLNPFHPEAVATYGQIVKTCEDLGYMGPALEEVHQYLIEYPSATERRYGAAIGLKGGHGSGKTHLLMWLAEKAKGLSSIQPIVLYAKADRASFADLYSQLMSDLSREKMQELLGEALTNLATEQVGKAKATEAQEERITTYKDLEGGMQTKIDLEQLVIQLQSKLDRNPENPIPDIIPRTLTLINNPRFGEKAYQWLLGKEVTDLAELNLNHYLFQLHQQGTDGSTSDSSVPDHTAIVALETVAALLLIAQRPLIVLVDQLEVLLRADPQRQQTLFSVIKKMVEQLNNQKVLTFIAGNNESWEILPPDVTPRLRRREPLSVGNLSLNETKSLLEAYTDSLKSEFEDIAIETIHALSGGNPREIIRIAYYAFNDRTVMGDLSQISEAVLIRSASESRTVEDRNKLALTSIDSVLSEFSSTVRTNISIEDNISLDRLLVSNDLPRIALMMMKATDKLSEISSARRFSIVRGYIEQNWPTVPLICISVGYSSSEVERLVGKTSTILQFDDKNFAGQLRAKVTELLAQERLRTSQNTTADTTVLEFLKTIANRLDTLEVERSEETKKIAERFAEKTHLEAEPEKQQRETNTRWDLLNSIDRLQDALGQERLSLEREIIRSILVANEANLKIKQIDFLGGLYLDLLSESSFSGESEDRAKYLRKQLLEPRANIIREIRRLLRGKKGLDNLVEEPWKYSLLLSIVVGLVETVAILLILNYQIEMMVIRGYSIFLLITIKVLPVLLTSTAIIVGFTFLLRWFRLSKWERIVRQARRKTHAAKSEIKASIS